MIRVDEGNDRDRSGVFHDFAVANLTVGPWSNDSHHPKFSRFQKKLALLSHKNHPPGYGFVAVVEPGW